VEPAESEPTTPPNKKLKTKIKINTKYAPVNPNPRLYNDDPPFISLALFSVIICKHLEILERD
jgi:hypothetical protein